jgi:NADH-quinone oxidoreductase subunit G
MDYDRQESRFPLQEKVKKEKAIDIGPLVMLDQERCILCTRCTRFLDEVAKTGELGVFERGDHCEINLFPGRRLDNAYSGNVVDICPVGALTNKDFRFRARVWYLEHTPSVCPSCATGCNIDIHHRRSEVFRFRPRRNDDVNRFWMCDEGRMSYKRFQGEGRLLQPVARDGESWSQRTWEQIESAVQTRLAEVVQRHGASAVAGVVSAEATNEEAFLFARWIRDGLQGRVAGFRWSPPNASHDEFLVDADKNPNSAGLKALGLDPDQVGSLLADIKSGKIRALALWRTDFPRELDAALLEAIEKLEFVAVFDTHYRGTAELADVLLPIGSFAETDGTLVNRAGRVQRLREAFAPPSGARAGWRVLAKLIARSGGAPEPADAAAVFTDLAASVAAFRNASYKTIGSLGVPLEGAAA